MARPWTEAEDAAIVATRGRIGMTFHDTARELTASGLPRTADQCHTRWLTLLGEMEAIVKTADARAETRHRHIQARLQPPAIGLSDRAPPAIERAQLKATEKALREQAQRAALTAAREAKRAAELAAKPKPRRPPQPIPSSPIGIAPAVKLKDQMLAPGVVRRPEPNRYTVAW